MTWKLTRGLKAKAVYQDPDTGRWISRIYGKNDPQGIATILIREREENRQIIEVGRQTEIKLDRLQVVVDQMIQQHLVCNGLIYRHNRWQFVANLKHPLTPNERNLIRRTKAKIRIAQTNSEPPTAEIPPFERTR